ncbi:MAG: Ryanodine receptor Ryr [Butyrivibrio sp.]|nr:Ryanodine receptor Ryr [Butyrivibrio sp.]
MNDYIPAPMDVSDIELPKELDGLVEKMAENVHEVWAKARIEEGWRYGEERNDALKTTPCLVPYDMLPETEKEYDRNTAIGTLKLITRMGYTISPSAE